MARCSCKASKPVPFAIARFSTAAQYAVVLDHFAQRVSVIRNEMGGLGSGGVQATGYGPGTLDVNGHHVIRRNYIHDTGRDHMHSAAVTIFGSGHNDVSLNWIADCPYAAVQVSGANQAIINDADHPQNGPSYDLQGDRTHSSRCARISCRLPSTAAIPSTTRTLNRCCTVAATGWCAMLWTSS